MNKKDCWMIARVLLSQACWNVQQVLAPWLLPESFSAPGGASKTMTGSGHTLCVTDQPAHFPKQNLITRN